MRQFAISDIHGCVKTFKALLDKIEFQKIDTLYLLGDYIDRGPDSKGVIDHILELQANGFQVQSLRGNHEQMMLEAAHDEEEIRLWVRNGGTHTIESFQVDHINDVSSVYIDWLKALPFYFMDEQFLFVHAGISFEKERPLQERYDMLWKRRWYDLIDKDWLGERLIIHGHTPTKRDDIERSLHTLDKIPALNIDNGCVFYKKEGLAHLCAVDLSNRSLHFQANIDVQPA